MTKASRTWGSQMNESKNVNCHYDFETCIKRPHRFSPQYIGTSEVSFRGTKRLKNQETGFSSQRWWDDPPLSSGASFPARGTKSWHWRYAFGDTLPGRKFAEICITAPSDRSRNSTWAILGGSLLIPLYTCLLHIYCCISVFQNSGSL